MIVRSSSKCVTCGQVHTVRIGMGQETRQTHRFPCMNCGEDMVVALNVDYQAVAHGTEAVENAEFADEEPGAPTMNVDPNFIALENERHVDQAFPRLTQLEERYKVAKKYGSLVSLDNIAPEMLDLLRIRARQYRGKLAVASSGYLDQWKMVTSRASMRADVTNFSVARSSTR